ncbi:MAG TPA: MgtC/SapB family protein [Gammaproteobacteria bacterium]|nr:MgtC/SapB family protein [Gammaproteobacteria bacterium]
MEQLTGLAIALAIGLLVGIERGWSGRGAEEGGRVAGIRTFGLLGLLGGLWALLAGEIDGVLLGFAFLALTVMLVAAHWHERRLDQDVGTTTVVASLVTFALGALAVRGLAHIAVTGAVVTVTLLSLKPTLHRWVRGLEPEVFYAALKLLLISVVLLPVLPDQGYGPWQALNPHRIWWMVVLIAGLSFAGYLAMKLVGAERGILLTGLLGGMVSSTATTLTFSRLARQLDMGRVLAASALIACTTMFPRMLIEIGVINRGLLAPLTPPLMLVTALSAAWSLWLWKGVGKRTGNSTALSLENPLQLGSAVQFGLLLAIVMLASRAAQQWAGDTGIYLLALASGLADVDAITLSLAQMAHADLSPDVAGRAIILAALANTLVKGLLVVFIAGGSMAKHFTPGIVIVLAAGLAGISLL